MKIYDMFVVFIKRTTFYAGKMSIQFLNEKIYFIKRTSPSLNKLFVIPAVMQYS